MNQVKITSLLARQAREFVGLSQGKVASELGINRSYLSQFESGKRILSNNELDSITEFYQKNGFEFPDDNDEVTEENRVMDGFILGDSISTDEANELLSEYVSNQLKIEEFANNEIERGIFNDILEDDKQHKTRELLLHMARNYVIIEELHGRAAFNSNYSDGTHSNFTKVGEALDVELHKSFSIPSMPSIK